MLYQTHHPFFFPLNPFTTPILSLSTPTTPPPLPPSLQEMDCVEGALKTRFGPDPSKKTPNQPFSDDPSTVNGQSGVSGDDFFVDDLLDFSEGGIEDGFCEILVKEENGDGFCGVVKEEETEEENKKDSPPSRSTNNFSVIDDFPSVPCTELSVPTKARSKRSRTGFRVWSLDSISLTDSSSTSSSSSSTTQTADSVLCPPLQPAKKQRRRKLAVAAAGGGGGTQQPRRCSHCLVQKTPQWRAGPLGAKTLCNACGVRFKSGRLLPEYRPACSPTFLSDVHSNNHRKVLEMRRKKEDVV
ncbi:hypothetical protein RHGRI_022653 [Rhododendron griersonianum]|uniref:GATA-type domain-containing protein n=1 Tax=Rhododendron griersonianum TaxID=479676 RepID=A0AAV6J492_9ERIC|nr:hypothetical protein RHGRI_022653 [Rhododendron griersonianum]